MGNISTIHVALLQPGHQPIYTRDRMIDFNISHPQIKELHNYSQQFVYPSEV